MQWFRIAFILILALAPAVAVTSMNVSGQSYTTITTASSITEFYPYSTTSGNETRTTTSNLGGVSSIPFSLKVCGQGAWYGMRVNAILGQRYHIEWETDNRVPITLFIVTYTSVGLGCDPVTHNPDFGGASVLVEEKGPSGSVDWVAPSTDRFIVAVMNFSDGPTSGTFRISTVGLITSSYTSYASSPTTRLASLTLTSAVPPLAIVTPQVGLPFGILGLLVVGAVVAVIAGVLLVARRRKPYPAIAKESARVAGAQPIISTGYADLDKALEGGIPEKFSVVIVSPSFDERDLLLRKVVNSALSSGRLALLISNDIGRTEDMTSRYPKGFYAFSPQADKVSIHSPNLLKIPGIENLSEASISLGISLKEVMAKEKATKGIMIIDILPDMLLRHKSITTRRWLTDFVGKRKAEGFTIIATLNPLTTTKEETQSIIDFFDGVIEIFEKPLMERARRFLVIKKMYGQRYSENEVLMDKDKLF